MAATVYTQAMNMTLAAVCKSLALRAVRALPAYVLFVTLAAAPGCVSPVPRMETGEAAEPAYRLQPGDRVNIEVFREPEISGVFQLNPDGQIRHPMLGNVPLGGMTVQEAEAGVCARLAEKYLVDPRVILKVENRPGMQVLVMGEVKNPGGVPIGHGERLTLLDAIARAGGFTEKASLNRVRVVRTVDGQRVSVNVRVADVLEGRDEATDIPLMPNDVVTVPEIWF